MDISLRTVDTRPAQKLRRLAKLFFDPQQLVILRDAVGA
jgi:hypothetical protein